MNNKLSKIKKDSGDGDAGFLNHNLLNDLFKSEIFKTLSSYMEILKDKIFSDLCFDENGEYVFRCKIYAKRLKLLNLL